MRGFAACLVLVTALSGCAAPAASGGATPAASGGVAAPTATVAPRPPFLSYAFADVRDGKPFRLTDFPGKTVLVIGMAVW
jgi:hypothetical protein